MSVTATPGEGEVRVFADYDGDFVEEADVVVVGSGPTGAVVTHELARAGRKVVLLEEGPPFTPDDFVLEGAASMARTMREGGLRATRGYVMPTMQPIALGGGSLVNSAICPRAPAKVLDDWCTRFDLSRTHLADLDPHYDAVADFLGIAPTPDDVQGPRNLRFRDGCKELGYSSEPIPRNVRGCRGSGECFTGCRNRAKQSMDVSYIPAAIALGARVLTSVRVVKVETNGRRAEAVVGRVVEPFTGKLGARFRVNARMVVLAAGCVATPVILHKSGNLANRSGQVGENLQFHPGVAITGVFPERTHPQFGATQGYQSLQFIEQGFKLETLWAPPAVLAVRTPGFGYELKKRLAEVPYSATWDAITSCHNSLGKVVPRRRSMDPVLKYHLHDDDVKIMQHAFWVLAEIFFAAGARKIQTGIHGLAEEMNSLQEAEAIRKTKMRATDIVTGGNHVFCTTRMHGDPTKGVVDEDGQCHDLENLYIADTGIFPRCSAVNPMFTGMALAHRQAGVIEDRLP
ncbi:MAG: GMC family oxidoreductase [Deltaproteobacteria bacterium]|nr:GMC family oxidoreductase [Deltaproteobacteria bacterium]MBW2445263.1 GMC family oxidoreductase [Deltaproteobacteria bacterium]